MRNSVKIVLLIIAIVFFALSLYFALPAIPKKISNEVKGSDYIFEEITFNLSSKDYLVNKTTTDQMNLKRTDQKAILLVNSKNEKDFITIIRNSPEFSKDLNESFSILKNPFRHKALENEVKGLTGSSNYKMELYKGDMKYGIITRDYKSDTLHSWVDVKLDNSYYTLIPGGTADEGKNIMEFLRTVSIR